MQILARRGKTHSLEPPGSHRRGKTRPEALGLRARSRHACRFNSEFLTRLAPHSEGTLGSEADTSGPDKKHIMAGRGLSAVAAFKHSQAMPRWLTSRARLARHMTKPLKRAVCKPGRSELAT